jgi:subtilisin family serine protease
MSGTSQATPAVTGLAARRLAEHPEILNGPRNEERAKAILQLLVQAAESLGLGTTYEGLGLPR